MKILVQESLSAKQIEAAFRLWNNEYPEKLKFDKIEGFNDYLNNLDAKKHFLLIDAQDVIVGWSATFLRDNERWFAIILNSDVQGKSYGTSILNEIKKHENRLAGWAIDRDGVLRADGHMYKSPLQFYIKNGFNVQADNRIESERISAVKITWQLNAH
ncbi:GNAT family N-acetyltransferase [Mucilaginibacter rubeus]|uniref:GNAT family N-acetyltransferase n=1 Tax=Mucilaginibacter rubeus TaxID=2027860 RepID=A0A5C1I089_9SPHI|nr:GNAT family N-acetyltransferase [Mucilaginibacter rubeus]QEM10651.1 GNAT family N-acetyltransferase [Mucilaginibacter rubeus]